VAFTATDPNGRLVDMGTAQSDASGNVTYSFVLSSEVPGIDTEQATGQLSGMYAFTTFDPGPPTNLNFTDVRDAGGGLSLSWTQPAQTSTTRSGPTTRLRTSSRPSSTSSRSARGSSSSTSCSPGRAASAFRGSPRSDARPCDRAGGLPPQPALPL